MGYEFAGFFALAELPVLEDAFATWPGCRGRTITEPFQGIGVAVPERALTYGEPRDEGERARELAHTLEEELVTWSQRYPATQFVFVRAECFGGQCMYWGYVCQSGMIQERTEDPDMNQGMRYSAWCVNWACTSVRSPGTLRHSHAATSILRHRFHTLMPARPAATLALSRGGAPRAAPRLCSTGNRGS